MEPTTPVPSPPITNPEKLSAAPLGTTQDQARSANNPTQKTRRGALMEAIILRHIDSVFPGRLTRLGILHGEESIEDIDQKMEGLKNPIAKFRRGRALTHDTVRARLHTVGYDLYPIPLDKLIQDVIVKREFLSKLYGGSGVPTFPNIGATFDHGLHDFMYPNLDHNPHCPQVPGASGLFFEAEGVHAFPWPKIQRVITRIQSGWWQYQGQYRLEPSVSLTRREWASQGSKFHNTWAKEIHKKQWGKVVRAKIFLRETLGREFSQAELLKAIASERSFRAEVTPDKIIRAFARGEESIAVWTMKCVGYDNEFQHNIANKFPTWELQHKDSTTQKRQKQGETQKTGPNVGKKRKRVMREAISDEDGDSSTDSDVDELVYSARGTRSRPIVL
ncbi:hypothetical protein Hypma_012580 [Hypsizygus marmoreus]|uniref:DUF6697 domain-containing protein n=1 Tax=Hypsizygus marmoreus TaxID=39966 RepID=A0A369JDP6_HYPMA|nr:hypothetical protein Hypma_012580 [Hypsizygus marmoreus]